MLGFQPHRVWISQRRKALTSSCGPGSCGPKWMQAPGLGQGWGALWATGQCSRGVLPREPLSSCFLVLESNTSLRPDLIFYARLCREGSDYKFGLPLRHCQGSHELCSSNCILAGWGITGVSWLSSGWRVKSWSTCWWGCVCVSTSLPNFIRCQPSSVTFFLTDCIDNKNHFPCSWQQICPTDSACCLSREELYLCTRLWPHSRSWPGSPLSAAGCHCGLRFHRCLTHACSGASLSSEMADIVENSLISAY